MKNQIKGIALILSGILLSTVGVASQLFAPGAGQMVWCAAGLLVGAAGLVTVFMSKES